jgi:hypothetical protein
MPYAEGCRDCGGETDGTTRCKACREKRRKAAAALSAYRREHGLCLTCGEPVAKSKLVDAGQKRVNRPARYCKRHLGYYAERQRG